MLIRYSVVAVYMARTTALFMSVRCSCNYYTSFLYTYVVSLIYSDIDPSAVMSGFVCTRYTWINTLVTYCTFFGSLFAVLLLLKIFLGICLLYYCTHVNNKEIFEMESDINSSHSGKQS